MNTRMVMCKQGHHYDELIHSQNCPYCEYGAVANIENKTKVTGENTMDTVKIGTIDSNAGQTSIYDETVGVKGDKTEYVAAGTEMTESTSNALLSGWLVIVSEGGKGLSFPLTFGMNTIGRDKSNHVNINNGDNSISREKHAVIIYDYQNNIFFIKHGDGQYLSYLNDEVLLENKELKANDKIKIGSTELIFIPLCSESFAWEQ